MFSFEIEHNPADKHKAPDGLSRCRQADEDSNFSDGEIDIEEGVKFLKLLDLEQDKDFCEMSMAEFLTEEIDPCETSKINKTRLDRHRGECMPLEVRWENPTHIKCLIGRTYHICKGRVVEDNPNGSRPDRIRHAHQIDEYDSEQYWQTVLRFLLTGVPPSDKKEVTRLLH
ncbi:uncharacterized protein EI90DRAFT_3130413 [Cantharellus anzutake]|uniref:uncharacterized protein n=1 Tax=Cantharellus anzutake TaxID=1750568 RepID=UPI00190564DC|nr:uncharacterized protein EI90DRAFT_3130413 [Cantharellus anzutake]KAF8323546.1 hypothetical protein EI90DRAFT_3130413 [Cantharellus anzutake]